MLTYRYRELLRSGVHDPWAHPEGGGKGGSAPPGPDYVGAAEQQGASGKENLTMQTWANRPTMNTPWGQMAWSAGAGVDPSTGQPITQWTGNVNLTPEQQSALDAQQDITQGRSGAAQQLLGQATGATATPFNWNALPQTAATPDVQRTGQYGLDLSAPGQTTQTTNAANFADERRRIENSLFEQMRPEHQRQTEAAQTRLANQGLTPGSEAYNRELERLQGTQAGERFNALQTAGGEQARLNQMLMGQQQQAFGQDVSSQQAQNAALQAQFGQGAQANAQNFGQSMQAAQYQNQLRQQGISEQQMRRGMPLSELNALLTGQQVNMPQMPQFGQAGVAPSTQYLGAAQQQGQYGLDAAQLSQSGGADIGSLVGAVGGGLASNPAVWAAL